GGSDLPGAVEGPGGAHWRAAQVGHGVAVVEVGPGRLAVVLIGNDRALGRGHVGLDAHLVGRCRGRRRDVAGDERPGAVLIDVTAIDLDLVTDADDVVPVRVLAALDVAGPEG